MCIPHVQDERSDAELLALSGADLVLRPQVHASEAALRRMLDRIAGAQFVLTASLHGAIVACAYERRFAFWDNGHLDVEFKWRDFAASIGVPCEFVRTVAEGEVLHAWTLQPRIVLPPVAPMLDVCPFTIRPAAMLRALVFDGRLSWGADAAQVAMALDALPSARPDTVHALQDHAARRRAARARAGFALLAAGGRGVEHLKAAWRQLRGVR